MKIRPKDIGLPFKEVPFIFVGECPGAEYMSSVQAHTHICLNDPYRNCICVGSERILKSRVIMWHEYAHVLTPKPVTIECNTIGNRHGLYHSLQFPSENEAKDWNDGHNKVWAKIMRGFGLEPKTCYLETDI